MSIDFKSFFPYDVIRPEQEKVLNQIAASWNDKKYFILQLDVGTGKSGIAKTVANWSNDAFIITETKQLQEQYIKDFGTDTQFVSIKGKANYQCNRNPRLNCENGPCTLSIGKHSPKMKCKNTCKYYMLRERALKSRTVLTSYAYIFRAFDCAGFWKPRQLMVFDECHLLENQLVNFASFELNPFELDKLYGLYDECKDRKAFLKPFTKSGWNDNEQMFNDTMKLVEYKRNELFNMLKEEMGENDIQPEDLDEDTIDALQSTHKMYYKIDKLYKKMTVFKMQDKNNWVIEPTKDGSLQFTPLFVNSLFKQFCNNWADKFIFMSATILDIDGFIKDLGINKEDCLVMKVESTFDPKKSPIYHLPCGSMNYSSIDASLPKVCDAIKLILKHNPNSKGIIHTGNYKVAKYIYENVKDDRLLMKVSDEISNQNLLKVHSRSKNTVLLSPSMTTGVDLKDDLSRFQIIVKMPFSSLADTRIKKKSEISSDWYSCEMLKTFIQACGRSTRSVNDYSTTYVLDSSFRYWINKYQKWLPQQFLQRLIF